MHVFCSVCVCVCVCRLNFVMGRTGFQKFLKLQSAYIALGDKM